MAGAARIRMSTLTSSAPKGWFMRRDPPAYLWDVREVEDAVASFMQGRSFSDYARDLMFRSTVGPTCDSR